MNFAEWLVVIPARLDSQRLPRKPLADLAGKPLIQRVWENLSPLCQHGAQVVVATDSKEVAAVCRQQAIAVEMTLAQHPSGSDRCQEVAARHNYPYVLNVQGDEPFIHCDDLLLLMKEFSSSSAAIGTLVFASDEPALIQSPHTVKVVKNQQNCALYFSRLPIPYWREQADTENRSNYFLHLGVYAFTRKSLAQFCQLPQSSLEQREKLEQLRALENGLKILLVSASHFSSGIDTLEDLQKAQSHYK